MIVLDTHIWLWWVDGNARLKAEQRDRIQEHEGEAGGIRISAISCWEVAKSVEQGTLTLSIPVREWLEQALAYPGVRLQELTPAIAVESTQLPSGFHKDPADQIIVATARLLDCPLITSDAKILAYPHVRKAP